jgi:hypothetical protein
VTLGAKNVSVALVAAVVTAGAAVSTSPAGHPESTGRGGTYSDRGDPAVALTVRLRRRPGPMLLAGRTLWVGLQGVRPGRPGRLLQVEARTGRIRRSFSLPVDPLRLASGFGSLWLTGQGGDRRYAGVLRLDPRSGRVTAIVRRREGLGTALTTTAHAVWVGGPDRYPRNHPERSGVYFVYKIDPQTNAVVRRFRLRSTVIDLAGAGRSLWITGWYAVAKLRESGRVLLRQPIRGSAWSIARAGDGVWAAHTFYGTRRTPGVPPPARELFRIREASKPRLTVVALDESPWEVSAAGGVVWVALGEYSHDVERFGDSQPPMSLARVPIPGIVHGLQATRDGAWVSQLAPNGLSRIC